MATSDDLAKFKRYLCLGSEVHTLISAPEKVLPHPEVPKCLTSLLKDGRGEEVVAELTKFSREGRCHKQTPLVFALAVCSTDEKAKKAAYDALADVCRLPSDLFLFVKYGEDFSGKQTGWGRLRRKAIAKWYNDKDPKELAMYVTKYRQRHGWSHRDVIRLAHIKPKNEAIALVLGYVSKGLKSAKEKIKEEMEPAMKDVLRFLEVVEEVKASKLEDEAAVGLLISEHKLVREHVPTWFLSSKEKKAKVNIWKALLPDMPVEAMLRSLGRMTAVKVFDPHSLPIALNKLNNEKLIRDSKVHPFTVLQAWKNYTAVTGSREQGDSKQKWIPESSIIAALETAFNSSVKNIEATNKRILIAIDSTPSMTTGSIKGADTSEVKPIEAAAAMAKVTLIAEKSCEVMAFNHGMYPIETTTTPKDKLTKMPLDQFINSISEASSQHKGDGKGPIKWALDKKKSFDVFLVFTDNNSEALQSDAADMSGAAADPSGAAEDLRGIAADLREYREKMKRPKTKLVVCALCKENGGLNIADCNDNGMLDICGFDAGMTKKLHSFIKEDF